MKYTGSSDQAGLYSLPQIPVGRYDFMVEATGFNRYLRKNIEINVAQTVTLNVSLAIGAVTQTVEVTGAPPAIETSTSAIGTVVNRALVMDLPLSVSGNMRNPESFIFLTPGVSGSTGNTQINGSQSRAKEVLFDGAGATSPESGGTLFSYPSVEAISEFKLIGSSFSAEYGRTGGGFEVFTTKSGANDFHGDLFDYLRNNVFDARGFYAKSAPINRQNEYGVALGGPVLIPKIYNGANKTFFYFVYSGFRYNQASSNALVSIPPPAFRGGDFSSLVDRSGKPLLIYDPATTGPDGAGGFTRSPFPGNLIPPSRISSVSGKIAALLPAPTNSALLS
ncbi:MAG: TonB-dependent receptor, partial [Pseudomonadota bacterium]